MRPGWPKGPKEPKRPRGGDSSIPPHSPPGVLPRSAWPSSSSLSASEEREIRSLISGLARVSRDGLSGSAYAFVSSAGVPTCEVTLRSCSGERFLIHLPLRSPSSGFLRGAVAGALAVIVTVAALAAVMVIP